MSHSHAGPRRVLCVYPCYPSAFSSFGYGCQLMPNTKTLLPPMGLLIIAAYLPKHWDVRFIDESARPATDAEYQWADVILTTGAHQQRELLAAIAERAHHFGKLVVIGGPSVSACPEYYPMFDILHIGELGDATDTLLARIEKSVDRPETQVVLKAQERLPLEAFPDPAYNLVDPTNYVMLSIQWSSGCPFTCEFCDIPDLYGRNPRLKSPERMIQEIDAAMARNPLGAPLFFVDDNLIGNRKALKTLLPHIIDWQKKNNYPARFTAQTSLDLARDEKILAMMREAGFIELFIGIESSEEEALFAMSKKQNTHLPPLEAVQIINKYGMGVSCGIIIGLDTDTEKTVENLIRFTQESHIPMPFINILYAPPNTALWRRLEAAGRLLSEAETTDSNINFKVSPEVVRARWEELIDRCYAPSAVFDRLLYNAEHVHTKRIKFPPRKVTWQVMQFGLSVMLSMFYRLGLKASYRRLFHKLSWQLLTNGQMESLVNFAVSAYHMFQYRDEVRAGRLVASVVSVAPDQPASRQAREASEQPISPNSLTRKTRPARTEAQSN